MSENNNVFVPMEEQITDPRISMQHLDLLHTLCPQLAEEVKELKRQLRTAPDNEIVNQKLTSLHFVAMFATVYQDIATFCGDNGFDEVINISPHFMYAAPFFKGSAARYTEVYPERYDSRVMPNFYARSWIDKCDDYNAMMIPEIYVSTLYCDNYGAVAPWGNRPLLISVDGIGWPGTAERSGITDWTRTFQNVYNSVNEAMIFMPKFSKPTKEQYPGNVITVFEMKHKALNNEICGLYLLTKRENSTTRYID